MGSALYLTTIKYCFLFLSLFHLIISSQPLCHDYERSALLQFKSSFLISMSVSTGQFARPKLASWKVDGGGEGSECCLWDGVECSKRTGHVTGLDLGSSFLYGSINSTSSLFSLVHLRRLDLSDNDFNYSRIPSGIARLSRLMRLNLSASVFSGQIPSELLGLSRLVSLDLALNVDHWSSKSLLRLETPSLEILVQKLTNLEILYLGHVYMNARAPETLANMTSLTSLTLHHCALYGDFPVSILLMPSLQFVWLFSNENLTGYLPEFDQRSSLMNLDISETSFSGPIPDSLGNLSSLRFLSLAKTKISGVLPDSLGNLRELTGLYIAFINIDLGKLFWLGRLTKLIFLKLEGMNLQGELPSSLSNLTQLQTLSLMSNNFAGLIPLWLMNMTQLTDIDLSLNQLQGPIPSSFSELRNLELLNLNANNLSGTVEANIFLNLTKLSQLLLSRNHISFSTSNISYGIIPKFSLLGLGSFNIREFPEFLRYQDALEVLSLTQNMISVLPEWMLNRSKETSDTLSGSDQYPVLPWTRLGILDLTNNMLQGPIPIPPPHTFYYSLSNNRFTGEIPPIICNLSSLLILDLSNNSISGSIPLCLGNFSSSLTVLNLQGNNFRGTIPKTYTKECGLKMINLSQNQLEGLIPSSLANCTMLQILDLGNNQLEDSFPMWLGALLELQVLVLPSNKLYGGIQSPANNYHFPSLRIIDLSNNFLTGDLPVEYFQHWNAMKIPLVDPLAYLQLLTEVHILDVDWHGHYEYSMTITNKGVKTKYVKILVVLIAIDLSSNKFTGEIPDSVGSLKGIQSLNFSNNDFTGHITSSIRNLTELESLDFSVNKLSGKIPEELAELSFLAFLNVSFNNLDGPIPQGKQFSTFQNNSYEGNLALCGDPLSVECGSPKVPPPSTIKESDNIEFLSRVDWIVMFTALGGGLVVGLVYGQTLTAKNHDWFVDRFGKRPKSWQGIPML